MRIETKVPSKASLKEHYAKQLEMLDAHGLGLLNCDQNPTPRPERFVFDELLPEVSLVAREFRTPMPNCIDGCDVLLIGCGTGADAYVLAKLVGPEGHVLAIDPDPRAIKMAKKVLAKQQEAFGGEKLNLDFAVGYPERLDLLGIDDESLDSVVFNLTINLSPDKPRVIREIWRCLKPNAEIYGSILIADRRFLDPLLRKRAFVHPIIRGAVYMHDFRRMMTAAGWPAFRYMEKRRVEMTDKREKKLLEKTDLTVRFIRMFKIDDCEDTCENYGQSAEYLGTAPHYNQFFDLDDGHRFFVDKPLRVCGNTCALVADTRFSKYFRIAGGKTNKHFGVYDYCPYSDHTMDDKLIIEYNEDGKESCKDCSHREFCTVDGHCQHEEGADPLADVS